MVLLAVSDEHGVIHGRDQAEIMSELATSSGPERLLDLGLRTGPYGDAFGVTPDGLTLDQLISHPHGIDLGALRPRIPDMLRTPSGRIDLAYPAFVGDLDRLDRHLARPRPPMVLIGRRHLRSNNSWQHNIRTLMKGKPRCVLQVHPEDAQRLGLADQGRARVTSASGSLVAPVEVSDTVMPGVVSLPHGWGHDVDGTRLAVARERPGANVNVLGSTHHVDPLSGNPQLNGIPVSIEAIDPRAVGDP
jgi:anaerobic selenocysteine-containing dehydrogenase